MNFFDRSAGAVQTTGARDPALDEEPEVAREKRDANGLMMSGATIGVLGAVGAAVSGAVCPVCVVAAPALLGLGAFRRWRAARDTCGRSPAPTEPGKRGSGT